MRAWLQRNAVLVTIATGIAGGLGYIRLVHVSGTATAWVMCISALAVLYDFLVAGDRWPHLPAPIAFASAFVWISFAFGSMLLILAGHAS